MTWREAALTLQLLSEQRMGTALRERERIRREAEEAAWAKAAQAAAEMGV